MEPKVEDDDPNKVMMWGRDIRKIPCMRSSLLYGISGGILTGLASFLFNSKSYPAIRNAAIGYCVISNGYFIYCRHQYREVLENARILRESLETIQILEEGERIEEIPEVGAV